MKFHVLQPVEDEVAIPKICTCVWYRIVKKIESGTKYEVQFWKSEQTAP